MHYYTKTHRNSFIYRLAILCLLVSFGLMSMAPQQVLAQGTFSLPAPGQAVLTTLAFTPTLIKGIKVYPDDPLRFDFIVDTGEADLEKEAFNEESAKLIKYFLATLTVPEKDLWVNLSPYEKERIVPDVFGTTEMGRDLLAQDYILKQLTASLVNPKDDLGKRFWEKVYTKAYALYGTTQIPVNTFNKVWVVPDKAVIYENGNIAFIAESHLKVMSDSDYVALRENLTSETIQAQALQQEDVKKLNDLSSEILKEVILPAIEEEVNTGENFAQLRQIYHSMILATWFKRNLEESLLGQIYVGKNKVSGVDVEDKAIKEKIYQQYLEAFKVGVYNFIKPELDARTQKMIPRKYFSGGMAFNGKKVSSILETKPASQQQIKDFVKNVTGKLKTVFSRLNFFNKESKRNTLKVDRAPKPRNKQITLSFKESRQRLIADKLGIPLGQMSSWEDANSEKAKQLKEIAQIDDTLEVFLKNIDSNNVIVDRSDPAFENLYTETDEIVRKLVAALGFNPDNFEFYLLDSTDENAFALRYTNKIFINIGLIKFIVEKGGSKDALAFVLAHELRHIQQWVDDFLDGKPLPRGINGLLSSNADEYDADYALAVIDKAGYSVRDAGFFFEKFIAKSDKSKRFSFGFLSHPPMPKRLRKIERHVAKLFWLNFFNKSAHFSDESKKELNHRTARRVFQEQVARSETLEDFERCFDQAQSIEDFIFTLMVAFQKVKGLDIDQAYDRFMTRAGINDQGRKDAYQIILDIAKRDLRSFAHQTGFITRGSGVSVGYGTDVLTKRFEAMSMEELMNLLRVEVLRPREFDSYDANLRLYDFNYAAYAASLCCALDSKIKGLYKSGSITEIDQFLEFMDLFRQRYMEIDSYLKEATPPDVKSAFERIIGVLLQVLIEKAKVGHEISDQNMDTLLRFVDMLEGISSYSEGEGAIRLLCEFAKNASLRNKEKISQWLSKDSAETASKFRTYFFEHMARNIDIMDALPGMGQSAQADIDILFSNPYFTKHSIFYTIRTEHSSGANTLMTFIYSLKQKYNLSTEQTAMLWEHVMAKLEIFSLDSKTEDLYKFLYKEIGASGYLEISDAIDHQIAKETNIPNDLNPVVKKLIYFYKMGGALSFKNLREVFFLISSGHKNRGEQGFEDKDVQAFFDVLIGSEKDITVRYDEEKLSEKELRWNKYILPFSLFLSFDKKALIEEEVKYENTDLREEPVRDERGRWKKDANGEVISETKPGIPTRFGRFIGEFISLSAVDRYFSRSSFKKTKVERGRGINRVFLTGEDADSLLQVFDYIVSSEKDFETLLTDIKKMLPATTYRNFALYILFIEKMLKKECGASMDTAKMFDLSYIQNIITNLDAQTRAKALQALSQISSLTVRDAEMEKLNEPNQNVISQLTDEEKQSIESEHAQEEGTYHPFEHTELGGALFQLDVFVGLLVEQDILDTLKSGEITFQEKLDLILKYFNRPSNSRDRFLSLLVENGSEISHAQDIENVLAYLNSENFREKYAVLALEKRRAENKEEFLTLEGELKWILHYFPELSPTRDDILLQLIDEKANVDEDMSKVRPYLLRAPENIRDKKQTNVIFGTSVFGEYMKHQSVDDKLEFLLWVFGISETKPFFLKRFEQEYNVSLNGMRDNVIKRKTGYYKNVGDSAMDEFLEEMLLGENGIFDDPAASKSFEETLFNTIMPSQNNVMRAVYDAIFRKADINRKYTIVSALLNNFSKEKGTPQGISEARAIRIFLGSLGLIGVKLAQFLSTNDDVSEDIRNELKLLKDRAPQLSKDVVFDMIAKIYGSFNDSPISQIFECIGSASIKVVYRALLKNGKEIVIKIKRPEVEKKIKEDLDFLRAILSDQVVQEAFQDNGIEMPQQLGNRIAEMILEEMNLRAEAENQAKLIKGVNATSRSMRLINKIFNHFISKTLRTPQKKYSFKVPATMDVQNNTLILEELVSGQRIDASDTDAMVAVARELMRQIFVDGFYHADPHTGNIFVSKDGGVIYFIDVGSAVQISIKNRYLLYKLMKALQSGKEEDVLKMMDKMAGKKGFDFRKNAKEIADSNENVVKKILMVFKALEDSNVSINPELISVFRCFGQGESLFKAALVDENNSNGNEMAASSKKVGGIDLNPNALDLQVQGDSIKFNATADLKFLESSNIEGFSPVILQVVPTHLDFLLQLIKE